MYQNESFFGIFPIFLFSIRKSCCRLSSTEEWNFQIWSLGCRADMLLSEGKGGGKEGSSKRNRISKLYNQQSKTWTRWSSYFDLQFKYCTNVDNLSVKQLCVMPVIWDKSDMRMRACEKLLNGIVKMWSQGQCFCFHNHQIPVGIVSACKYPLMARETLGTVTVECRSKSTCANLLYSHL